MDEDVLGIQRLETARVWINICRSPLGRWYQSLSPSPRLPAHLLVGTVYFVILVLIQIATIATNVIGTVRLTHG